MPKLDERAGGVLNALGAMEPISLAVIDNLTLDIELLAASRCLTPPYLSSGQLSVAAAERGLLDAV